MRNKPIRQSENQVHLTAVVHALESDYLCPDDRHRWARLFVSINGKLRGGIPTKTEIAKRAGLKLSALSRMTSHPHNSLAGGGQRDKTANKLRLIAELVDVDADWLLFGRLRRSTLVPWFVAGYIQGAVRYVNLYVMLRLVLWVDGRAMLPGRLMEVMRNLYSHSVVDGDMAEKSISRGGKVVDFRDGEYLAKLIHEYSIHHIAGFVDAGVLKEFEKKHAFISESMWRIFGRWLYEYSEYGAYDAHGIYLRFFDWEVVNAIGRIIEVMRYHGRIERDNAGNVHFESLVRNWRLRFADSGFDVRRLNELKIRYRYDGHVLRGNHPLMINLVDRAFVSGGIWVRCKNDALIGISGIYDLYDELGMLGGGPDAHQSILAWLLKWRPELSGCVIDGTTADPKWSVNIFEHRNYFTRFLKRVPLAHGGFANSGHGSSRHTFDYLHNLYCKSAPADDPGLSSGQSGFVVIAYCRGLEDQDRNLKFAQVLNENFSYLVDCECAGYSWVGSWSISCRSVDYMSDKSIYVGKNGEIRIRVMFGEEFIGAGLTTLSMTGVLFYLQKILMSVDFLFGEIGISWPWSFGIDFFGLNRLRSIEHEMVNSSDVAIGVVESVGRPCYLINTRDVDWNSIIKGIGFNVSVRFNLSSLSFDVIRSKCQNILSDFDMLSGL